MFSFKHIAVECFPQKHESHEYSYIKGKIMCRSVCTSSENSKAAALSHRPLRRVTHYFIYFASREKQQHDKAAAQRSKRKIATT